MFFERLKEQYLQMVVISFATIIFLIMVFDFFNGRIWRNMVNFLHNQAVEWKSTQRTTNETIYKTFKKKFHNWDFWWRIIDIDEGIWYVYWKDLLNNVQYENWIQIAQLKETTKWTTWGIYNIWRINSYTKKWKLNVFLFTRKDSLSSNALCKNVLTRTQPLRVKNDSSYEYKIIDWWIAPLNWSVKPLIQQYCSNLPAENRWYITWWWIWVWPIENKAEWIKLMKPYKDSILLEIVRVNNFGAVSDLIKEDEFLYDTTKGIKKNKSLNKKELTKEILTKVEDGITYLILLPL